MTKHFIVFAMAALLTTGAQAGSKKKNACKNLEKACIAAGYSKGNKEGKDVRKDCLKPLVGEGKTVEGVTAPQEEIDACKVQFTKLKTAEKASMKREKIKEKVDQTH